MDYKFFTFFRGERSPKNEKICGNGWLIDMNGRIIEPDAGVMIAGEDLEGQRMAYSRPATRDDLAIDWVFVPGLGHFFRVRYWPRRITTSQRETVARISERLKAEWNQPETKQSSAAVTEINATWTLGREESTSDAGETFFSFEEFDQALEKGDWTTEEMNLLRMVYSYEEQMERLGRILELDVKRKKIQVINSRGDATIYSVSHKDVQRIRDALKTAWQRAGLAQSS